MAEPESGENGEQALVDRVLLRCCREGERCLRCANDLCLPNTQVTREEECERESECEYFADEKNRCDDDGNDEDESAHEYRDVGVEVQACGRTLARGVNPRAHGGARLRRVYDGASPPEAEQESPKR